jgi:hypothetical protein
MVFTAWGAGGFFMARLSQTLFKYTGSYAISFITGAVLLILALYVAVVTPLSSEESSRG